MAASSDAIRQAGTAAWASTLREAHARQACGAFFSHAGSSPQAGNVTPAGPGLPTGRRPGLVRRWTMTPPASQTLELCQRQMLSCSIMCWEGHYLGS